VVLAKSNAIDADLVSKYGLVNNVADDVGMAQDLPIAAGLNIAEGVETKLNFSRHWFIPSIAV
jgi:hypothetical protein